MNIFETLKKEHQKIERELIEIETVVDGETINYPNLFHVFKKFNNLWNNHEKKEEKLFSILSQMQINSEIERLLFDHREIRGHKKVIADSIKSGDETEIKASLDTDAQMLIEKIKKHFEIEAPLFSDIPNKMTPEQITIMRKEFS
jgi:hypothetical protein